VQPARAGVLATSAASITRGGTVTLTTTPTRPGYEAGKVTYEYRWQVTDAQGRPVTVSGSGASVQVATGSLACGSYSVTTTVTASVPAVCLPPGCVTTRPTTCTPTLSL